MGGAAQDIRNHYYSTISGPPLPKAKLCNTYMDSNAMVFVSEVVEGVVLHSSWVCLLDDCAERSA